MTILAVLVFKNLDPTLYRLSRDTPRRTMEFFTVRNSNCGKVIFSQVSVYPQEWGGVHPPARQTPPRAETPSSAGQTVTTGMHSCPKCFTEFSEFSDKNICHCIKRARTCHLLYKKETRMLLNSIKVLLHLEKLR